eukprot:203933-Pleurochrysis_carterae.AAC.1
MVSIHHAYQARLRGIRVSLLPPPAREAHRFMTQPLPLAAHELGESPRRPPCEGMAHSFMPGSAQATPSASNSIQALIDLTDAPPSPP